MSDENTRSSLVQQSRIDVSHELHLRLAIQRRGLRKRLVIYTSHLQRTYRLIKKYDRGILQKYPSNRQPLLFPTGDHQPSLPNSSLIPMRQPLNSLINPRTPRHLHDLFITRAQTAIPDIMHNVCVEKRSILRDHPDMLAEGLEFHCSDILVVDRYCP